ncbi:putative prophage phiRv2 integrase [Pelotomaculum sp. FP]|uniref:tyrosine-type recombinase/integrase n=1 Tax=Pelotomaculum sp. FP TaxID=261474 RepID=UPI001104B344|nr:site-specific integrase [Pelotomaculum sp. FP]TEB17120.1 putative prophage phiRv2 integrase [Pelotomaculum sp. FP]
MELTKMLKMVGLTEDEFIGGFTTTKKGYYYTVLNRKDQNGKRKPLWISTGLSAIEENEAEAESKCLAARIQYSLDLKNGVADKAEKTLAHEEPDEDNSVQNDSDANQSANPLFADLLKEWLAFRHPDNIVVGEDFNFDRRIKLNTWAGYADNIERNLYPTFKAYGCTVREITPDLLKGHYAYRLKSGKKKSTVVKDYTIINQALNYAVSKKMISVNPNSAITLHKIEKYNAATLNAEQMLYYLEFIVGDVIEIPILLGGFYGMRRSECVGTRECQFDFRYKFFRANHTVTTAKINKEKIYIPSDKLKTDLSNRTYPLIPYVEERIKTKIAENKELRELCGNSYSKEWLGYLCVHPLGEIIDPGYITNRHADLLKKAGLPHVRFHDLRHSCVGLMMANEVPMERIKDWVGHSDIRTTVNTYGHLEYQSKKKTAKIIQKSLPLKKVGAANL